MNLISKLGVVAGALILGSAAMAPAQAQSWHHGDAAGDVTTGTCDASDNCTDAVDPALKVPDVTRFVADHRARRVNVYARYADLTSSGTRLHIVRFVTNEGVRRHLNWVTYNGNTVAMELDRDSDGNKVACRGIRRTADYAANTVTISVPRACLSSPRTVRVGFGSVAMGNMSDETQNYAYDDAVLSGSAANTSDLVLGPVLRRA
jgi:hypothetical protein